MPKYSVTITEEIVERRTYEFEADDARSAAEMAANEWIVLGNDPPTGKMLEVPERTYEVHGGSDVEAFDCTEVEG